MNKEEKKVIEKWLQEKRVKGGKTTKKKFGIDHYKEIGKKGAEKRWKKPDQAISL